MGGQEAVARGIASSLLHFRRMVERWGRAVGGCVVYPLSTRVTERRGGTQGTCVPRGASHVGCGACAGAALDDRHSTLDHPRPFCSAPDPSLRTVKCAARELRAPSAASVHTAQLRRRAAQMLQRVRGAARARCSAFSLSPLCNICRVIDERGGGREGLCSPRCWKRRRSVVTGPVGVGRCYRPTSAPLGRAGAAVRHVCGVPRCECACPSALSPCLRLPLSSET